MAAAAAAGAERNRGGVGRVMHASLAPALSRSLPKTRVTDFQERSDPVGPQAESPCRGPHAERAEGRKPGNERPPGGQGARQCSADESDPGGVASVLIPMLL